MHVTCALATALVTAPPSLDHHVESPAGRARDGDVLPTRSIHFRGNARHTKGSDCIHVTEVGQPLGMAMGG
jgi:hypothetical protein